MKINRLMQVVFVSASITLPASALARELPRSLGEPGALCGDSTDEDDDDDKDDADTLCGDSTDEDDDDDKDDADTLCGDSSDDDDDDEKDDDSAFGA